MDAKDLRTESALGTRNNDGTKYSQGSASLQAHRNKQYQDIGSNSLAKVNVTPARPCAVIGPDRVVPPPITDSYLKKAPLEPWLTTDNTYRRPPEYPHKLTDYQNPSRNISPRQTFQENMQRIMVPPSYNSAKLKEDHNFPVDANVSQLRNNKLNVPPEAKYCDVPYVNPMTNEQKNARSEDISVSNMNPVITRSVHGWPPSSANVRPAKPYGAHPELYQYPDYSSCAGPRPMLMTRPHRTVHEEPGPLYSDPYYHDGNIRFKPYPTIKERYPPQARYEYIGNYSNPFHPPPSFPSHKYDPQKPLPPNLYPGYSQVPLKYLDPRMAEHVMNGYQRPPNQQASFNNVQFRNQVIQSTYGAAPGNCLQNKFYQYPPEGPGKPITSNKIPYDTNNKTYVEYENARAKNYPMSESFYVNEIARHQMKGPVLSPNYASVNMHPLPPHPYYRKENPLMKNYEYSPHFRNVDPSINLSRLQSQYSLNTYAISPSDSSTSNDTTQTHAASQEDCGYVSQSSTASIRSVDSGLNRIPNDLYRRYDYRYGPVFRTSGLPKPDQNSNNAASKGKKGIDVRQFLSMWNEGEDDGGDSSNKVTTKAMSNNANNMAKQYEATSQEQLYVLGLVNVPSEELGKYEHIQKVSKLPENIKGYNSIELLNQFEEVIESSNLNNFSLKPSTPRDFHVSLKSSMSMQSLGLPPRPVSPLDVEAKISQSVIHKEVGCNFEIKPCSPKMLNVEVAAPIQTVLDERVIEKVSNPLNIQSPVLHSVEDNTGNMTNVIKPQDHRITLNDNSNVNSCKMVNTQFSGNDSIDPVKANNYTLQDLESNAGICLASLPRLDNDCELNFPEVNQQFINANKVESVITPTPLKDLPPLDIDQCDTSTKDRDGQGKEINQFSPSIELGKEFPKLSKYRKLKRKVPDNESNSPLNHQVIRTDSVIIKNPENIKSQEDSAKSSINNFAECVSLSPINLTTNTDTRMNESGSNDENLHARDKSFECAIDFSLNSNEHNGYKSKYHTSNTNLKEENNSFNENLYVPEKLIDNLDKEPSKKSESNCDTRKTCENNSTNSYILEDTKKAPTCEETVINFCTDTVAVNNKLYSSTMLENESDAMTKLLCEAASKSVQFESDITGKVDIEEKTLNNSRDEFSEKISNAEDDNPNGVACCLKTKTDLSIDNSNLHEHSSDPLGEDLTTKEFSRNMLTSKNTAKDHLSADKEPSESEQIDRNVLGRLSSSEIKYDFDDKMDVENKMESLFSDTMVNVNEWASPKDDSAKESKTDSETESIPDVQLDDQHNLLSIKLVKSNKSKCDESEYVYIPHIKTRRYVNKELFSPWIQKLIYNEGLIDSSFDNKNNLTTKASCGTLNKRTSNESETFTCRISEYTSEKLETQSEINKHILENSNTGLWSNKLSVDELDYTICTETVNNIKTDNYVINETNDKLGCESNLDYLKADSNKDALKESETKEERTLEKVGINTNIDEPKVNAINEPFLEKIIMNDLIHEAIVEDRNEILQQEITDPCDDTTSNVKSKVLSKTIRTETNSPISDEVEIDSLVNTVSVSVSDNINPLSVDESISNPILCNLDLNSHDNETIVDDVLCKTKVAVKHCLDETKTLPTDNVIDELDTEGMNTIVASHSSIEKANEKSYHLLLTDDKEDELEDEVFANINPLRAEESICKPILCNLDSDPYSSETIVDNSPKCKPKLDEITNEPCVDETKTFSFIKSIIDELDTECIKTSSRPDKNISIEKADRKKLQRVLEDDKEDEPDDQNNEKKILEQETNQTNDYPALESNSSDSRNNSCSSNIEDDEIQKSPVIDLIFDNNGMNHEDGLLASSTKENLNSCDLSEAEITCDSSDIATEDAIDTQNIAVTNYLNDETQPKPIISLALEIKLSSPASTKEKLACVSGIQGNQETCDSVDIPPNESVDVQDPIESNFLNDINSTRDKIMHETAIEAFNECNLKEGQIDICDTKLNDSHICNSSRDLNFLNSKYSTTKRMLKRSYSESALDEYNLRETSKHDDPETNFLKWPKKRKKICKPESYFEQLTSENYCNIIQNSRRKSISTICEQNVSFCILIDDNCILTEDDEEETEKICFTEITADCLPCVQNGITSDDGTTAKILEMNCLQEEITSEFSNQFTSDYVEEKTLDESWVEDVACVETVVSDDIAEDIVISASVSPKDEDSSDYESNNDESGIFSLNEHTDKLKYIYGDKMCSDDAQLVETLYRTPQMDVNKTLVHRESQITDDCHRYYDEESLERVLSESNNCELKSYDSHSIAEFTSSLCPSGFVASDKTPDDKENVDMDNFDDNSLPFGIKNIDCDATECENPEKKTNFSQMFDKKTQDDTVHSCESSIDNVFSYNQPEVSPKYVISSSSEVSSTTSEDKNSSLYLKITKYRETSTSQVSDFTTGRSVSCKYTEKKDCLYSNSSLPSRPLITKAAQKYIPPLKETLRDLKVKLPLPQNSLQKLKQLKISKEEPKPNLKINKHDVVNVCRKEIPKKPKPKFEDVLKSIDEIQFKKHKEKSKKHKSIIPKVVIKKSVNGSHYASTSNKDKFNPDLTGRKWQPWVFLEKNNFIDKMALRRKTKAVFSHRKNTYVLAEKFQKYKSISSAKFIISQPKFNESSPGQLKYTIRLKHTY